MLLVGGLQDLEGFHDRLKRVSVSIGQLKEALSSFVRAADQSLHRTPMLLERFLVHRESSDHRYERGSGGGGHPRERTAPRCRRVGSQHGEPLAYGVLGGGSGLQEDQSPISRSRI